MRAKTIQEFLNEDEARYSRSHEFWPVGRYENSIEKRKREAKEFLENNVAYLGTFRTIQEVKKFGPQDNDWILRSADGDGNILIFNGDLASKEDVNELKSYYHYAQDINYFDARPITYTRWLKLPDEYKIASRRNES